MRLLRSETSEVRLNLSKVKPVLSHRLGWKPKRKPWLPQNRPPKVAHWNLLTDLKADHLAYAA
jgi:hypothetical protein